MTTRKGTDMTELEGTTVVVTGASRGFGRAIATAFVDAGATVVGTARSQEGLDAVAEELGSRFVPVRGDAADPTAAADVLRTHRPQTVVLNAGATPLCVPLQDQTWETFSQNWHTDVQQAFHWCREALLLPLERGSTVIAFSSGAALQGSPMSGGYAGANATVRFIASYAAEESRLADHGIRFVSVLPKLTPDTDLGRAGVAAYAERAGLDVAGFLQQLGPSADAANVARQVRMLATDTTYDAAAYLLPPQGEPHPL